MDQGDKHPSIPQLSPVEDWWIEKPQNCLYSLQIF